MRSVLISGASIAGPALAYWLHRHGFAPTVVERAPAPRPGGQAIDIRGVALDVVERMGLLERVREMRTRMRGMSVLDGDGNEVFRSTEMTLSSGRLDSDDIEVLRDDLTSLLYEHTRDDVEYVFGDSVTGLTQDEHGVRVEFANAEPRTFDLVVGADGLHSAVRRLAFGPESEFLRHLGTYIAIFGTDNILDLDNWQIWVRHNTREGVGYAVYPARDNTELRVTLGFRSEPLDYDYRDVDQQKRIMAEQLADLGWETPRLLAAMHDSTGFFFDAMAQIHMDRWSTGRVTLVGDAGYCPSPLSGQGTSLALVGAYVLADELRAAAGDHESAFQRYEERMRPFVTLNQALATDYPQGETPEEATAHAKNAISLDR
ncbi:FAD-dependent monooxygenase [Streptoalloteichus hindustanus]|uniref:2-polyprenyl-6-methoxyphenol hydroxylase n=1 Tax=Streptoalloteichus hindustanus TaxID=2017 RepID=A0A1M4ZA70_STRHI|nr:FAD-dependent monooxygenase [Streptoalloteichus hindustanus]SHF14697.1 2-polyprenyl-6-methoxyphenol hydroxylase [Streptoalloteichus hindustanus]